MRRGVPRAFYCLLLGALLALAPVAVAAQPRAAAPKVVARIGTKRVNRGVSLKLSLTSRPATAQMPDMVIVGLQGFSTAVVQKGGLKGRADSVDGLCSKAAEQAQHCPAKDKVASGSAVALLSGYGQSRSVTLGLTAYLGVPRHSGCAASLQLEIAAAGLGRTGTIGDLCSVDGALLAGFSFPPLASVLPAGVSAGLSSISLNLGHSYEGNHLLITPPTCQKRWRGGVRLNFGASNVDRLFALPCMAPKVS